MRAMRLSSTVMPQREIIPLASLPPLSLFTVLNLWSFLPFSQQDESHKLLTYSGFHSITDEVPRFSQCPHLCSALSMLRHQDVSHAVITI